jgi:DNA-binding CsgD family transcriptional regulator
MGYAAACPTAVGGKESALVVSTNGEPTAGRDASDVWIVFRFQHEARKFVAEEVQGRWEGPPPADLQFRMGEEHGLIGWVGALAQPFQRDDIAGDPRWTGLDPTLRSLYLTPIARQGEILGVLLVGSRREAGLDALHRELSRAFAHERARRWSPGQSLVPELESDPPPAAFDLSALSQREREVVSALCRGLRLSDIARLLGISNHTARNHLKHVFRKLGVHSQVELLSMIGRRSGIPEAMH